MMEDIKSHEGDAPQGAYIISCAKLKFTNDPMDILTLIDTYILEARKHFDCFYLYRGICVDRDAVWFYPQKQTTGRNFSEGLEK